MIVKRANYWSLLPLYWKCQIIGWSAASLYWCYTGFLSGNFSFLIGALQFFTDVAVYIWLTNIYRQIAVKNNWRNLGFSQIIKHLVPSIFIMGGAYTIVTVLKIYLFRYWFFPITSQSLLLVFKSGRWSIFNK